LITLLAPGFTERPEQLAWAIEFTRITFAYLGCLAIVSQYGAMLNAEGKFVAAASAPVLLNIAMTLMLLAAWLFPTAGHAAAYGVLAGGVLELVLLYAGARRSGMQLAFTGL